LDAFRLDGREDIFFQTFSPRVSERVLKREDRDLSFFGSLKSAPVAEPAASERECVCVCASVRARVQRENADEFLSLCVRECFRFLNRARALTSDEFALAKKKI